MIFYYLHESKQYAIYFGQQKERVGAYAQSMSLTKWKNDALWLFPLLEQQYTSWPLGKSSAVEDIEVPNVDLVYRLGLYELRLKNGKKYLYLSQ